MKPEAESKLRGLLGPDVDQWLQDYAGVPSAEPDPASDLGQDSAATEPYLGWHLAASSLRIGIAYLDTFRSTLNHGLHLHPPIALLRGALETSGTAVWLVESDDPRTRRQRGLAAWWSDLNDRHIFEQTTSWQPDRAQGRLARARQKEIKDLAQHLGLASSNASLNVTTWKMLRAAALAVGETESKVGRLWALSSGLAHGRYWPAIIGDLDVAGALSIGPMTQQRAVTPPDWLLLDLAKIAHRFTVAAAHHLRHRSVRPS